MWRFCSYHTTQLTQLISHLSRNSSHSSHPTQLKSLNLISLILSHSTLLIQVPHNTPHSTHLNSSHPTHLAQLISLHLTPLTSHHSIHSTHLTQLTSHNSSHSTHLTQLNSHNSSPSTEITQLTSLNSPHSTPTQLMSLNSWTCGARGESAQNACHVTVTVPHFHTQLTLLLHKLQSCSSSHTPHLIHHTSLHTSRLTSLHFQ